MLPRVDHVVAVLRARARLQRRRQIEVRDAEVAQVRDELARLREAEVGRQLQAVGRAEAHAARREHGDRARLDQHVGARREPVALEPRRSSSTSSQRAPNRRAGSRNVMSSKCALKSSRNESSRTSSPVPWSPRASSSPFRNTPIARDSVLSQSRRVMRRPSGRIHHTSGSCSPLPSKNFVRRNTGCARRSSISCRVNASSSVVALVPVEPRDLVVLAPRVVVAALRAAPLVAAEQHRHALREQQRREEVPLLARAQRVDRRIVGRPLGPAVPRAVVVGAVLVALAVRLVVLLVVRDEVAQREAVVRGDEVDRRERPAPVGLVEVGRAAEPRSEIAQRRLAAPEVAHRVAVDPVPLGPQDREVPDLVAARPDVPRLGDQLHLREDRILVDDVEERREAVDLVELARERRREVEAEPVDVAVDDEVAQRVHDQPQHRRVHRVERVARAGVVHVEPRVLRHEPVVALVVDAAEAEHRAEMVALGGVVVDDVEDHLDAGAVQRLHHALELAHLHRPSPSTAECGAR